MCIGDSEYPFKNMLLRDTLPCLQLDHPDYAVEKVTFEMAGLRLEPGQFRTEPLPIDFARRAAAIVEAVGNYVTQSNQASSLHQETLKRSLETQAKTHHGMILSRLLLLMRKLCTSI